MVERVNVALQTAYIALNLEGDLERYNKLSEYYIAPITEAISILTIGSVIE